MAIADALDDLDAEFELLGDWEQRYRHVIDNYQTTTHVPEALERLTECYTALGLTEASQ